MDLQTGKMSTFQKLPFTQLCNQTEGCTRRAPSAKLRLVLPTLKESLPPEVFQQLCSACEKCSRKTFLSLCATHEPPLTPCASTSCYRIIQGENKGKQCDTCLTAQRVRQRTNYRKRAAETQSSDWISLACRQGAQCTHCSATIAPEELRPRKHGRPGWVQKCEHCLQRNREYDARRRRHQPKLEVSTKGKLE